MKIKCVSFVGSFSDPNDEVELINGGPVSTNDGDYDYSGFGGFVPRVRVFLIPVQESQNDSSTGDVGGFLGILKSIFAAGFVILI